MDIPYTVKARPDTGLWNAKIAIWLFLASEVMLFGGLFSAYIFLRVASDTPWPTHVLDVKWGFINTLLLITSSITVLQAWLSLKVRKYGRYQGYMAITIILAAVFMWIKLNEYGVKFHHYGVRLQDGSILEGHLKEGYAIQFGDVKTISIKADRKTGLADLSLPFVNQGPDGKFLKFAKAEVEVTDEAGMKEKLTAEKIESDLAAKVAEAEKRETDKRAKNDEIVKAWQAEHPDKIAKSIVEPFEDVVVTYTVATPVAFDIEPSALVAYDQGTATFRDGTTLKGKLVKDTMTLTADLVDVRRLLPSNGDTDLKTAQDSVANADVWHILGKEWKDKFLKHNQAMVEKYLGESAGSVKTLSPDFQRSAFTMELEGESGATEDKPAANSEKAEKTSEAPEAPQDTAEGVKVGIPKSEIAFYSNFTPKYHNFYAIYFALTSLHGLHIIGGAIVLLYFLLFGRKMYETEPEHLANRVEVGGLFWHFVDVVWMFLFPVLYLF